MKSILFTLFVLLGICLSGCDGEDDKTTWKESETFHNEKLTLYGTEGKFGVIKVNGEAGEPAFPVGQGRHYDVYFFDNPANLNGKKYKMLATHKKTKETVQLYEWEIDNNKSGAKFSLDKPGLWKIDVSVDEELLTSFIVKAEN
ncbi:MAG TPA: hypothetical protein VNR38_02275 [Ureibacillus sp.]|nr:hypothetical protein [Peribacillus asahii]USK61476.1 hypothetical protein LIT37_09220 [Peribacillus asahii]HWL22575.1 hypothetical protein [Ureibacillus sp.]